MAQDSSQSPLPLPSPPPQYVEVSCESSGKTRRFAVGTAAGFAVTLINRKQKGAVAVVSHIEAVKDDEEPIAFGPTSHLCDFGEGWKLQTVTLTDLLPPEVETGHVQRMAIQTPGLVSSVPGSARRVSKPISSTYIIKIFIAFVLVFVLGAIFTLFLDNLPALIFFVKSTI